MGEIELDGALPFAHALASNIDQATCLHFRSYQSRKALSCFSNKFRATIAPHVISN